MHQIIQLKPEDDIPAIRARLEAAEFAHVALAVPRRCRLLQSVSGMQLLRRAADDLGMQIALVTHDERVGELAAECGIPHFNSLKQAQRAHFQMQPFARAIQVPTADTLPPPPEAPTFNLVGKLIEWRITLTLIAGALLFLCVGAILFVPTAQVYLVPASVALTATTQIVVDSSTVDVQVNARSIPARRIIREISGTLALRTSATKTIPGANSTGTVVFTNLRAEETIVPMGTIVKTSAGVPIRFTTTATATLPAGGRAEAPIQAIDPGTSGNVKELAINALEGSTALAVRVINTKPTASGGVRAVRVVTENDKKKLEEQLLAQMKQQPALGVLQTALKSGEFIMPDSVLVDPNDKFFDRAVDEPADVLNLRMTADAFGLGVDREDLTALARGMLESQLQAGYQLLPDGIKVEPLSGGKFQGIQLHQPVRLTGYATPQLDPLKVTRAVQGKSVDDAKKILVSSVQLARPPEIRVTPPGWAWLPVVPFRIAVFIEPQAVSQ